MTFVQITTAPGLTADQYDAIMEAAHGGELAPGEIFHVAGAAGETWYVVDGWDSRDQCQQSMSKLMPAFAQSGINPSSFEIREFEIHKFTARPER
jgi:hypothetical protein